MLYCKPKLLSIDPLSQTWIFWKILRVALILDFNFTNNNLNKFQKTRNLSVTSMEKSSETLEDSKTPAWSLERKFSENFLSVPAQFNWYLVMMKASFFLFPTYFYCLFLKQPRSLEQIRILLRNKYTDADQKRHVNLRYCPAKLWLDYSGHWSGNRSSNWQKIWLEWQQVKQLTKLLTKVTIG
jgi:hypothetical protein